MFTVWGTPGAQNRRGPTPMVVPVKGEGECEEILSDGKTGNQEGNCKQFIYGYFEENQWKDWKINSMFRNVHLKNYSSQKRDIMDLWLSEYLERESECNTWSVVAALMSPLPSVKMCCDRKNWDEALTLHSQVHIFSSEPSMSTRALKIRVQSWLKAKGEVKEIQIWERPDVLIAGFRMERAMWWEIKNWERL